MTYTVEEFKIYPMKFIEPIYSCALGLTMDKNFDIDKPSFVIINNTIYSVEYYKNEVNKK